MPAKTIAVVLTVRQFLALRDALDWNLGRCSSRVFQQKSRNVAASLRSGMGARRPGRLTSYRTIYRVEGTLLALRLLESRATRERLLNEIKPTALRNAVIALRDAIAMNVPEY